MDQGSAGDCGLFRYRQFERVSEISGIPATHTVPTLFPDQFVPGCELIPDPSPLDYPHARTPFEDGSGISSDCSLHEDGIMRCDVQHNQKLSQLFKSIKISLNN